jgi:hypothetical protein
VSASDAEAVLELITCETPHTVGTVEVQTGGGKWHRPACGCVAAVGQTAWNFSCAVPTVFSVLTLIY